MSKGRRTTRTIWEGTDEFSKWLHETPGVTVKDVEAALHQEGENIMGVSKRRTPVDQGPLRASAHVKLPKTTGGKTSVTLAYGTDYAVYVHEIVSHRVTQGPVYHKVGQAKFLESAVNEGEKGMVDRLRRRVLGRIGKRGVL